MKRIILDTRKNKDVSRQGIGCAIMVMVFLIIALVVAIVQQRGLGLIITLAVMVFGIIILYAYIFFRVTKKINRLYKK